MGNPVLVSYHSLPQFTSALTLLRFVGVEVSVRDETHGFANGDSHYAYYRLQLVSSAPHSLITDIPGRIAGRN